MKWLFRELSLFVWIAVIAAAVIGGAVAALLAWLT